MSVKAASILKGFLNKVRHGNLWAEKWGTSSKCVALMVHSALIWAVYNRAHGKSTEHVRGASPRSLSPSQVTCEEMAY